MTGAASRRKGANFEREIARWLRDELQIDASRNLKQYQQAQEGDLTPVGPFLIECKNQARINLKDWWQQTVRQAKAKDLIPLLIYKVPRKGWRAVTPCPAAWQTGSAWRYDYEFTIEGGPAWLALTIRESL